MQWPTSDPAASQWPIPDYVTGFSGLQILRHFAVAFAKLYSQSTLAPFHLLLMPTANDSRADFSSCRIPMADSFRDIVGPQSDSQMIMPMPVTHAHTIVSVRYT